MDKPDILMRISELDVEVPFGRGLRVTGMGAYSTTPYVLSYLLPITGKTWPFTGFSPRSSFRAFPPLSVPVSLVVFLSLPPA